jgi:hypothetical protein
LVIATGASQNNRFDFFIYADGQDAMARRGRQQIRTDERCTDRVRFRFFVIFALIIPGNGHRKAERENKRQQCQGSR